MRQEGGHRICVKKLPPILVIQLKRFDYNFERDAAVKFNDYFEFPQELDMEPYTVAGLARRENEAVDCDPEDLDDTIVRKYKLRGMVVHSGQASGGHYYSFIKDGEKWYKFDEGDVTEVNMADDEEFKSQCWGGRVHERGVRPHDQEDELQEAEEVVELLHALLLQVIEVPFFLLPAPGYMEKPTSIKYAQFDFVFETKFGPNSLCP